MWGALLPADRDVVMYRISELRECIHELTRITSKPYEELGIDERYSIRYNIIVLAEALVALCLHIAKNVFNYMPKSYVDSVEYVGRRLGVKCCEDLIAIVKLRNLVVHRYWVVDDRKIYESVVNDFKCVEEFIMVVERKVL